MSTPRDLALGQSRRRGAVHRAEQHFARFARFALQSVCPRRFPAHLVGHLHFGAGGSRLWCSERTESTLGAVAVTDDGSVSAPERFTVTETQPHGFAVSPDSEYLVTAGEMSTTVSLYAVRGDDLELLQRAETGRGAN